MIKKRINKAQKTIKYFKEKRNESSSKASEKESAEQDNISADFHSFSRLINFSSCSSNMSYFSGSSISSSPTCPLQNEVSENDFLFSNISENLLKLLKLDFDNTSLSWLNNELDLKIEESIKRKDGEEAKKQKNRKSSAKKESAKTSKKLNASTNIQKNSRKEDQAFSFIHHMGVDLNYMNNAFSDYELKREKMKISKAEQEAEARSREIRENEKPNERNAGENVNGIAPNYKLEAEKKERKATRTIEESQDVSENVCSALCSSVTISKNKGGNIPHTKTEKAKRECKVKEKSSSGSFKRSKDVDQDKNKPKEQKHKPKTETAKKRRNERAEWKGCETEDSVVFTSEEEEKEDVELEKNDNIPLFEAKSNKQNKFLVELFRNGWEMSYSGDFLSCPTKVSLSGELEESKNGTVEKQDLFHKIFYCNDEEYFNFTKENESKRNSCEKKNSNHENEREVLSQEEAEKIKKKENYDKSKQEERNEGHYFSSHNSNADEEDNFTILDNFDHVEEFRKNLEVLPMTHLKEKLVLKHESEKAYFLSWKNILSNGFSILLNGFGSKIQIMNDFAKCALLDGYVCILRGYRKQLRVEKALVSLLTDAYGVKLSSKDAHAHDIVFRKLVEAVERSSERLYIVVHSIDNKFMREYISLLSLLSSLPKVSIIASVDMIFFDVLFDPSDFKNFNFLYQTCNTFFDYREEILGMYPKGSLCPIWMKSVNFSEKNMKKNHSVKVVLKSLTTNHKRLFKLVAQEQYMNPNAGGIRKDKLLTDVQASSLALSYQKLNLLLKELYDHEILCERRLSNGDTMMYIPYSRSVLKEIIEE